MVINLGANAAAVPIDIRGANPFVGHKRYTLSAWPDVTDMQSSVPGPRGFALGKQPPSDSV